MAAGLGFKTFTTGEVLTAGDVNGYLMQGILVFASAAARDAAITSPQEGQFAYLKDTNVTTYYTGSAWANVDTTGMTNPMTTTGDTIYSSSGSTPARLGIGSTGNVLTVAGGVPTWAAPAGGGGMTLLSTTTLSGTSTTISSINQTYNNLLFLGINLSTSNSAGCWIKPNGASNCDYCGTVQVTTTRSNFGFNATQLYFGLSEDMSASNANNNVAISIFNYASTTANQKPLSMVSRLITGGAKTTVTAGGGIDTASAISSIEVGTNSGNLTGTVLLYGVK